MGFKFCHWDNRDQEEKTEIVVEGNNISEKTRNQRKYEKKRLMFHTTQLKELIKLWAV